MPQGGIRRAYAPQPIFRYKENIMKKILASLLALCLSLSLCAAPAAALELEDAKELLKTYYVDPISDDVLAKDSLEEMLEALGDPYTVYLTADEYQKFLSSVNGDTVVGIGVSIQNAYEDGFKIMSVLANSPALEAGLEAGDRIIAVNGTALTASSNISALITGEEGTEVTITVIRLSDGQQVDYTLTRRAVQLPIVTYEQVGDAGLIDCTSFGESTVSTIEEALTELNDDVSVWIMDLRSNPGGTTEAAAGSAGLFVGSAIMVYFRDANGNYTYTYTTEACPDLTDKPLIILTSPYSASGSELFASDARDHGFGIAIGQRTYGKGIAQSVFDENNTPELFDGDALKVTTYRFYSPEGATNHIVGILPTLMISMENTPAASLLLSTPQPTRADGHLKLELAGFTFYIDQEEAVSETYKAAFTELLEALPPSATLFQGSGSSTWKEIEPADLAETLDLDYTGRTFPDIADSPFREEIETLAAYQLLGGCEDGGFHPTDTVTRAEFCTMIATALNLSASGDAPTFTDVSADAWYADSISAMAAKGFVAGCGDGTFQPQATITYQEMVTILSSVAAWCSMEGYSLSQTELSAPEWAEYYEYADWAQVPARNLNELGALVGDLAPTDLGTREVAAGMLCSLMEGIHLLWD